MSDSPNSRKHEVRGPDRRTGTTDELAKLQTDYERFQRSTAKELADRDAVLIQLQIDRTALIEGKVRIPATSQYGLWYVEGIDDRAFISVDEALTAYRKFLIQPISP